MLLFLQPTFLRPTCKLVYINAQRWPKETTDVCKRNRPFTVYGSIEKTLLDNWCVFVTINWINRSFKWIISTDRQQHMNWTAFWWQAQTAHDRQSRPNLCRCNSLSCPPGQLAPRGASCPGLSYPPPWLSSPPGGQAVQAGLSCPPPIQGQ